MVSWPRLDLEFDAYGKLSCSLQEPQWIPSRREVEGNEEADKTFPKQEADWQSSNARSSIRRDATSPARPIPSPDSVGNGKTSKARQHG